MSTFSKLRVGPKGSMAGVPKLMLETVSFDATIADAAQVKLPPNAILTAVIIVNNDMDSPTDTVDIGTTLAGAEIANELIVGVVGVGAAVTIVAAGLTLDDDIIYVAKGAVSASTAGGVAYLMVEYYIQDALYGVNA